MKVLKNGNVINGTACPGTIDREGGGHVQCDRVAVAVVENRQKLKCSYGHRWPRKLENEEDGAVP